MGISPFVASNPQIAVRLGCAVTAIEPMPHCVVLHDSHGHAESYDHVVVASRSDQALAMPSVAAAP